MEEEGFNHAKEIAEKATGEIILDVNTLSSELYNALKELLVSKYSQYYKDINIDLFLATDSVTIKEEVISAIFNATINMTLKADKVEDIPYMKGMLDYYNSKSPLYQMLRSKLQINLSMTQNWNLRFTLVSQS